MQSGWRHCYIASPGAKFWQVSSRPAAFSISFSMMEAMFGDKLLLFLHGV
jgi:hypothetical protein